MIQNVFILVSGTKQKRTDTRQDKLLTNVTRTQQSDVDTSERYNHDNDVLDCLASFYGEVS